MFSIRYEEAALVELAEFRLFERRRILDVVDVQLAEEPNVETRKRKLLAGVAPLCEAVLPVWQLRVGDFRVFYDVDETENVVVVRAIRRKGRKRTKEIL